MNGFFIGIDSGGTKCDLLITDPGKKKIFSKTYKGIHYSIAGTKLYSKVVCGFIKDAVKKKKLHIKDCLSIAVGIAGAREVSDRRDLTNEFQRILKKKEILITTDAMTALYGAFVGDEGIIMISGTGSVLYGYSNGKITRVGGWGRIIGDEGSGYWIGKRALNIAMKEFDRKNPKQSMLTVGLKKQFGIDGKNAVEKVFHENFEIQKIAPLVIKLAAKNCNLSVTIAREAVEGLIVNVKTFLSVSGRKKDINMAFIGSIIENKNYVSDLFKKEISKLKIVRVVKKKNTSAFGAILLASENSNLIKKL